METYIPKILSRDKMYTVNIGLKSPSVNCHVQIFLRDWIPMETEMMLSHLAPKMT